MRSNIHSFVPSQPSLSMMHTDPHTSRVTPRGSMCRNLREERPGVLENTGSIRGVAQCNGRPVFTDTRRGVTHIFTIDDSGRLQVSATVDSRGNVTDVVTPLGQIAPGECSLVRVGDFVVVSDAAHQLHYLLWNNSTQTYRNLGTFPSPPVIHAVAVEETVTTGTLAAQSFVSPVADMRQEVPSDIVTQLTHAMAEALTQTQSQAAAAGFWTHPVSVRAAVRMWDGTLLHLTDPVPVAPCDFVTTRHLTLQLTSADGRYAGTSAVTFSLPSFRLRIDTDTSSLEGWHDVAAAVEIWVSAAQSPMPDASRGDVFFSGSSTQPRLRVGCGFDDEATHAQHLVDGAYVLAATLPVSGGKSSTHLCYTPPAELSYADVLTPCAARLHTAGAIEGHGGFLHLAGYSRIPLTPSLPRGSADASERAFCRVQVTVASPDGIRTISNEGYIMADKGMIVPWMWYPDRGATTCSVSLRYDDGRCHRRSFALRPVASAENAAAFAPDSLRPVVLSAVADLCDDDADTAHTASSGTVMTMQRGNPLICKCITRHAGGDISLIRAQQSGGGAYTRQYLFLFSDTGITALTHDMDGTHRNCRPVSRQRIDNALRVVAADEGVWALSDTGTLLRLCDARVMPVLRGLDPASRLGALASTGELWILSPDSTRHSLVLDTDPQRLARLMCYERTYSPDFLLAAGAAAYGVRADTTRPGCWLIEEADTSLCDTAEWLSPIIDSAEGGPAMVLVAIEGEDVDAQVQVRAIPTGEDDESPGRILTSATARGAVGEMLSIPLMLPRPSSWKHLRSLRLRIHVRGRFRRISRYGLEIVRCE